ncbi:hypothetical protein D3C84_576340 [compost metagenome]
MKATFISNKMDAHTILVASGYRPEEAQALTAFLDNPGPLTEERLMADRKLKIAETLSLHWLVYELRKRATSPKSSPEAAVEALKILADISARLGGILKT